MPEIYKRLVQELTADRSAVLAAIVRQDGSSPRSLGSKFVVCRDGSLVGSIGGGKLEAMVIKAAEGLFGRDMALMMEIHMTGKEVAGTDMICGGNVDVLVQGITPANTQAREILEAVLRLLEKGGQGILAVGPLPDQDRESEVGMLLYRSEADVIGSIGEEDAVKGMILSQAEKILGTNPTQVIYETPAGRPVVLEPLFSRPTVIIFGGGHISVNLAPILAMIDFRIVVVDDREEFANRERFPQAAHIVVADFENCFDQLEFTSKTYCVLVTRGHLHDKTVLEKVIDLPTRYVGMIGSRRKRNMLYDNLMNQGVSPERLKEVYSPIGLDIGAETPEEIAIAIAAELIQSRAEEGVRAVKDWEV